MNRQPHTDAREAIVANAIQGVVGELRLVDAADYIAFMRLEYFACISDIVDSAAELFFLPGTLKLGHGGEARVDWDTHPRVMLDLELRPRGAIVYFTLELAAEHAEVTVNYVAFEQADPDPEANTNFLSHTLAEAMLAGREPAVQGRL